ncbi:uncharacterized protein LOC143152303 [Ptiloglossa arizonensis]|uniref:uncharacterized protein LOC143152303 n=1 Tax=Ptiloglossa arizonensis TaxID=3350558 RepID=UPI003F9F6113
MRQSRGVSASFPERARAGSVIARPRRSRNAYRVSETWWHRGYVCARSVTRSRVCATAYARAWVRACVRASGPARPWSTFASVVSPAPVHRAFSSIGPLRFFLRDCPFSFLPFLRHPWPLFQHSTRHLTASATVAGSRIAARASELRFEASRNCYSGVCSLSSSSSSSSLSSSPRYLFFLSVTRPPRDWNGARPRKKRNVSAVDALPNGRAARNAVRRRIPCARVLSAANKVIIVAGKTPGGKRATSCRRSRSEETVSSCEIFEKADSKKLRSCSAEERARIGYVSTLISFDERFSLDRGRETSRFSRGHPISSLLRDIVRNVYEIRYPRGAIRPTISRTIGLRLKYVRRHHSPVANLWELFSCETIFEIPPSTVNETGSVM